MKQFISAVLPLFYFLISCFIPLPTLARADADSYACILQEDVYFYSMETDNSGLFTLPPTYYVKVLFSAQPYTKVEYLTDGAHSKKLVGYCRTNQLTFVDYTPVNPYLYHVFDVTYTAETSAANDDFFHKITVSCTYYGDYKIGSKTYAYVLQNGEFGYVPLPENFSYVKSTEHAQHVAAQTPTPSPSSTAANPAQIAILVILCLLVPILAAIVLRTSKKRPYDFEDS